MISKIPWIIAYTGSPTKGSGAKYTNDKLKEVEKPGNLHQEMMGYCKKNKLETGTVSVEDVSSWLGE